MDIYIKESLIIKNEESERVVRSGTIGVENKKTIFFYDTTRTISVGFPRSFCIDNPALFSVSRNLTDREISLKDALSVVEEIPNKEIREQLIEKFKSL